MSEIKYKFQVGDIVRLKSGGPAMTVTCPSWWLCFCTCAWFTSDKKLNSASFDDDVLVFAE
jgi:uncharacterized protein YodC (DUF2158 family)